MDATAELVAVQLEEFRRQELDEHRDGLYAGKFAYRRTVIVVWATS